jgi:peroxiredoxin
MGGNPREQRRSTRTLGDRLFRIFLVVVFVAMVVELVLLVKQNHELKAQLSDLMAASGQQGIVAALKEGEFVAPLALPSLSGEITEIDYDDPEVATLLLIFSPDCPACKANMDNWRVLEQEGDSGCTRLFYISTADADSTRGFAADHGLLGPVLIAGQEDLAGYKVSHIPTTIVVGPHGVVQRVWVGVMPDGAPDEAVKTCGV